jgi:dTDP-4-dehydrorhamnose 3,5-epimerase-like enzyme
MKVRRVEECRLIDLPKIASESGNLTFIESGRHLPFEYRRVYHIYDIPGGAIRGAHAHKECHSFLIAISGSFDVTLNDGHSTATFHLNRSYYGLYICPGIWRSLDNFSSGAVCLAFASDLYDEQDYWRDYDQYLTAIGLGKA